MLSRQPHCDDWLKPNDGSMLYAMLCAVPGSGAGALTSVAPLLDEFDEAAPPFPACWASVMSAGLTVAGLATTLSVLAASLMSISVVRSCSRSATELFCGSASMAAARPLAPL